MNTPHEAIPATAPATYRAAPQQQREWSRDPDRVVRSTAEIHGAIDRAQLVAAIENAFGRHQILRTRLERPRGMKLPLQVVDEQLKPEIAFLEEGREASTAPLTAAIRVEIAKLGAERHSVCLSARATTADRDTFRELLSETLREYDRVPWGDTEPLQYGDYAEWIHDVKDGEDASDGKRFWGSVRQASLPAERWACFGATVAGALEVRPTLPDRGALTAAATKFGVDVPTLLLAAWSLVAAKHQGNDTVVVGVVANGRHAAELEGAIGPYTTRLPVALRTSAPSLGELAKSLHDRVEEARSWFEHYDAAPHGAAQASAEFVWGLDLSEEADLSLGRSLALRMIDEDRTGGAAIDLRVRSQRSHDEATIHLSEEARAIVDVSLLAARFESVLGSLLDSPTEAPVDEVSLVGASERVRLLELARPMKRALGVSSVLELVEGWIATSPTKDAVRFGAERLSYGELDARANDLASRLLEAGVGTDSRVLLFVERSLQLPVAILGILRAGAGYVPVDPRYPETRVHHILRDCGATVAVVDRETNDRLGEAGLTRILLDRDFALDRAPRTSALPPCPRGDQLAYVVYTSGSAGEAKGVQVSHAALVASTEARRAFWPEPGDTTLLLYSFAFDSSMAPIFQTLSRGGTVVVASAKDATDPVSIAELTRSHRASLVFCNPNLWRSVLAELADAPPTNLRTVVVAGEASTPSLLAEHFRVLPAVRLINEYGPTEATVWCTGHECTARDTERRSVPIGRPIENAEIYVLDANQRLVPIGLPGELYVGGKTLARGYTRAEMTADRFVPDAVSGERGQRLYRTGDRVRFTDEGLLEFLGRTDTQVKIRGYRVEPAEIERVIVAHTGIEEVAVVPRDSEGGTRLVAYWVASERDAPSVPDLRRFVGARLPEFMVPAVFLRLSSLPRTSHNKVDRAALPEPRPGRPDCSSPYVAPSTKNEIVLAAIWSDVLKCGDVGSDDNFFELGGDSIRAIQVRARSVNAGLAFRLDEFLAMPTLGALARVARDEHGAKEAPSAAAPFALVPDDVRAMLPAEAIDAYPASYLQAGMLFHGAESASGGMYQDLSSVRLRGAFDPDALQRALAWVAARHPVLRTSFRFVAGEPIQVVVPDVTLPFTTVDLRRRPAEERPSELAAWFDRERRAPFDLASAPLLRIGIHRLADDEFQFTWIAHHAIMDGWSNASFAAETLLAYVAFRDGKAPAGAPLGATFRDYVADEKRIVEDERARAFWTAPFERDFSFTPFQAFGRSSTVRGESVQGAYRLPESLGRDLVRLAKEEGISLKHLLLAVHLRVLAVVSGSEDVTTGVTSHGRSETDDGERTLGLFLNVLPCRVQLRGTTWRTLVNELVQREIAWTPYRRYPLAQIQRRLGNRTLFDTLFNYTHFHVVDQAIAVPGIDVLDATFRDEDNFPFSASFGRDTLGGDQLVLTLRHDDQRLRKDERDVLARWYERCLEAFVRDPDATFDSESLLDLADLSVLEAANETNDAFPETTLHRLFEERARLAPNATAILFEGQSLTYREVLDQSSAIAHALLDEGLGAERMCAVLMHRSLHWIGAVLGILRAGLVYVPLDPEAPAARTAAILEQSGASLVIGDPELLRRVALPSGVRVITVDPTAEAPARAFPEVESGRLAYVIFTSGSTGQPKAAALPHRAITNYLRASLRALPLGPGQKMLCKAAPTFDSSIHEMFIPLVCGATLVLARPGGQHDPEYLVRLVRELRIDDMFFTPTLLEAYLDAAPRANDGPMRLRVGGEELRESLVHRVAKSLPNTQLFNAYGPTETAIAATEWPVRAEDCDGRVAIGKPLGNVRLHVLDDHLRRVPPGTPGDLYISGAGVARGYLSDPRTTADRFLPDPFSETPGARFYRSGDRALRRANGELVFLGRRDDQVKIRGFRIELGEVEAELRKHPLVREAAVTAPSDAGGVRRLDAFVVLEEGVDPADHEASVRGFLRTRLPESMVPPRIAVLPELPRTSSGKTDRRALLSLERLVAKATSRGPETDLERTIAAVFAHALQQETIGVADDFFALGGDSLQAFRVVAHLHEKLGRPISIADFLVTPSIEGVVALVARQDAADEAAAILDRIDDMSPDEIERLLAERGASV